MPRLICDLVWYQIHQTICFHILTPKHRDRKKLSLSSANRSYEHFTTDPRVSKVTSLSNITSSYINLDQISSSESWPNISSKITTKLQLQNVAWTSTLKSWPTLVPKVWTKNNQTSASKSALNFCQHISQHQHQQNKTTSTSIELEFSHARVTSIKSTKQVWLTAVSQLVR